MNLQPTDMRSHSSFGDIEAAIDLANAFMAVSPMYSTETSAQAAAVVPPNSLAPIIELAARLCVDACRPVTSVIPLAEKRGEPSVWLPILRAHGLKGSLVMLDMLERGQSPLLAAKVLADAGYDDDEVLTALLENGVSRSAALDLLRAHGWSCERMVASLAHRGALLPDVRDQLVELGVPVSAQRALLLEHWEPAVVELVLGSERPARRLVSGD